MDDNKVLSSNQSIREIQEFEENKEQKVLFSYLGAFDEEHLIIISNYIEFAQTVKQTTQRTNLFKIFVEMSQNISQNSTLKKEIGGRDTGCGKITIIEFESYFKMISCNPATENDVQTIKERSIQMNALNKEELRGLKRLRIREKTNKAGNGNIGLIKIAIISENKIGVETEIGNNNKNYVTISVKINK